VSGGVGRLAVRDKAISDERYSGSPSYFSIDWNHFRQNRGFHLGFVFQEGSDIANGNLSATVTLVSLEFDFLYSLKPFTLFKKRTLIYLGVSTGTDIYFRQQNIASKGGSADDSNSIYWALPFGLISKMFIPISQKVSFEVKGKLNLFSFGMRFPSNANDELDAKLLHLANGFKVDLDFAIQYQMLKRLLIFLALKNQTSSITAWDEELLFVNSSLVLGLKFKF